MAVVYSSLELTNTLNHLLEEVLIEGYTTR